MPRFLTVALVVALAGRAWAADLRVTHVADGDTFTGQTAEHHPVKVRLHGIDAPETGQAFGNVSKKALADLIAGKIVTIEEVDRDRYGRVVANVRVGGKLVNAEQVRNGMAWRYVTYDRRNEFGAIEEDARRHRRGLWADAHPIPPWEWRKGERERKEAKKAVGAGR